MALSRDQLNMLPRFPEGLHPDFRVYLEPATPRSLQWENYTGEQDSPLGEIVQYMPFQIESDYKSIPGKIKLIEGPGAGDGDTTLSLAIRLKGVTLDVRDRLEFILRSPDGQEWHSVGPEEPKRAYARRVVGRRSDTGMQALGPWEYRNMDLDSMLFNQWRVIDRSTDIPKITREFPLDVRDGILRGSIEVRLR